MMVLFLWPEELLRLREVVPITWTGFWFFKTFELRDNGGRLATQDIPVVL